MSSTTPRAPRAAAASRDPRSAGRGGEVELALERVSAKPSAGASARLDRVGVGRADAEGVHARFFALRIVHADREDSTNRRAPANPLRSPRNSVRMHTGRASPNPRPRRVSPWCAWVRASGAMAMRSSVPARRFRHPPDAAGPTGERRGGSARARRARRGPEPRRRRSATTSGSRSPRRARTSSATRTPTTRARSTWSSGRSGDALEVVVSDAGPRPRAQPGHRRSRSRPAAHRRARRHARDRARQDSGQPAGHELPAPEPQPPMGIA